MRASEFITESREEFEGMTIEVEKPFDGKLIIRALDDWGNNILGFVVFNIGDNNELDPQDLSVDTRYQGQGIAKAMYDYVKSKGYTIHRSYDQTDAGAGFWNKHRGEDARVWEDVAEGKIINSYLWHGSRQKIPMLEPRQSVDTGGAAGSNQNAIYATSDPKVAIAMGLTTPGSDTGMFPNDPQMVLFSGKIRKGEYVYLHKLPFKGPDGKPQFVQGGNSREFHSIPEVKSIKPTEIKAIPVNKYLNLIRKATPADLKLRKKYMKEAVAEAFDKPHKIKLNELFTSYGGYELHHNPRNTDRGYIYSFDTKDKRDGEIIIKPKHLKQGLDSVVFVEFNIDGSTDTSGKGDAIMIFSTVLKAVNGFAREHKPQYIVFETEDPEKLKLYRRLVKYFVGYKPVDWAKDKVLNRQIGPELSGFAEEAIVLQRQDNADSIKTQSPAQGLYVIYGRGKYAGQVWHRFDLDATVTTVGRYTRDGQAEKFAEEWVEKNGKRLGNWNMNYQSDWNLAKDPSGLEFGPAPAGQYSQVSQQDIEYITWYLSQQQNLDKQGVAEAFDQPYPVEFEHSEYGDVDALTRLPDGTYLSIMFNQESGHDGTHPSHYSVEFYRNSSQEVTGEGDAYKVFATVIEAIRQFVIKMKPGSISFSASKEPEVDMAKPGANVNPESRAKLYNRLVQRYAGSMGYSVQQQEGNGKVTYTLRKVKPAVTKSKKTITEYRDRMYQYLKSIVPTWPDYIVKDWLYANFARGATQGPGWSFETIGKDIPNILKDTGLSVDTKWQLVPNMNFTMNMWEPKTSKRLQARAGGNAKSADPDVHIPANDAERHATQAALAKQQGGVRKEPVILIKTPQGYELLEGWHRTIQHFAMYPQGYTGPAWVAVAGPVQENFADGKNPGRKGLAKHLIRESASEQEIAQVQYMQGECAVLALTIHKMNPQRFPLGFVYEFFDAVPDMYIEPDEFDELDPAQQQDIQYNHENWTLTHAYVYDVKTKEYIDAEGRHKQLPTIGRDFNATRHNKFPAEVQDLVRVSHYMEWDEAQEKWIVLSGWDALDKAYTPEGQQRAREYAIKYLGIDRPEQDVAENFADGKNPGRKGLSKRMGVNTKASVSSLRNTAKHSSGEKARMAHWLANMKAGRAKKK